MKTNFVSHSLKYLTRTYLGQVNFLPQASFNPELLLPILSFPFCFSNQIDTIHLFHLYLQFKWPTCVCVCVCVCVLTYYLIDLHKLRQLHFTQYHQWLP